jgi:hypothetical protein
MGATALTVYLETPPLTSSMTSMVSDPFLISNSWSYLPNPTPTGHFRYVHPPQVTFGMSTPHRSLLGVEPGDGGNDEGRGGDDADDMLSLCEGGKVMPRVPVPSDSCVGGPRTSHT